MLNLTWNIVNCYLYFCLFLQQDRRVKTIYCGNRSYAQEIAFNLKYSSEKTKGVLIVNI